MTVAVCLKCGTMKRGAWTGCRKCGHWPEEPEDQARHLMTSDHYLSKSDLETISQRILKGETVSFDPQQVEAMAKDLKANEGEISNTMLFFTVCFVLFFSSLAILGIYLTIKFFSE